MYAIAILFRVRQARSADSFKYWRKAEYAIMFDPLERIQSRDFPPIIFMSKLEWNHLGNFHASDLKVYSAEVIDVDDKGDIPYIQKCLVTTPTKSRV